MPNAITTFRNDESGAVTVDWVVLTAALVGLGLAVTGVVAKRIDGEAGGIGTQVEAEHVTAATPGS